VKYIFNAYELLLQYVVRLRHCQIHRWKQCGNCAHIMAGWRPMSMATVQVPGTAR